MEALRFRFSIRFFWRFGGGRQELLTYFYAISESPFIGYGSWPDNPFYDELLSDLLIKYGYLNAIIQNYSGEKLPNTFSYFWCLDYSWYFWDFNMDLAFTKNIKSTNYYF